ncbi:MAG: hypothetical protein L6455_15270 [Kiritimatiellae bacterium]|nr:hypothetical protein [Kiritimatiellia bacterium]
MKNTFLDDPLNLRKYLFMAIGEASDKDTQAAEQKYFMSTYPTNSDLRTILAETYRYPRPLSVENFQRIIWNLVSKE